MIDIRGIKTCTYIRHAQYSLELGQKRSGDLMSDLSGDTACIGINIINMAKPPENRQ